MSKEFAIDKYLVGALYKAKLDAENKEFEYQRNGMSGIVNICAVFKPTKLCSFS